MKIAVTGASGFIGKYVVAELKKRNFSPTLILIPSEIIPDEFKDEKIVRMDIKQFPEDAFGLMDKPDHLIHLAWGGLPNYKSLFHFEEELPAQYRFLSSLIRSGLKSLSITGTCFEYGMQNGSLDEKMETQPSNPYGFAKDTLRKQLEFLQTSENFALTWFRLFYIYGEGQAANSIYSQLKRAINAHEQVFNMSGGEQLRDYLPITDIANYIVTLSLKTQNYGIVNICSGVPVSIRKLIEDWMIKNNWNIRLNLGYYPYPDYEPMAFWGNRRKLDEILKNI
jgi:dTDP-6-deoxy-L-talose 4-dehydrogenase (NAD+)